MDQKIHVRHPLQINSMIDTSSYTNMAVFGWVAVVAACWRQVLSTLNRVRSVFIVRVTVQGDVARALTIYCLENFRRSPIGDRSSDIKVLKAVPLL